MTLPHATLQQNGKFLTFQGFESILVPVFSRGIFSPRARTISVQLSGSEKKVAVKMGDLVEAFFGVFRAHRIFQSLTTDVRVSLLKELSQRCTSETLSDQQVSCWLRNSRSMGDLTFIKTEQVGSQTLLGFPNHKRYVLFTSEQAPIIAEGSMKKMTPAIDLEEGRPAVLCSLTEQFLPSHGSKGERALFDSEANILTSLKNSPGIVRLLEGPFVLGEAPYMLLDRWFCDLSKFLTQHPNLSDPQKQKILQGLIQSLATVHEKGYVHDDIKPENFLISKEGENIALTDFNSARKYPEEPRDEEEKEEEPVSSGTLGHMSPHRTSQVNPLDFKRPPPDPSEDIWSLGLVFFHVLSGGKKMEIQKLRDLAQVREQDIQRELDSLECSEQDRSLLKAMLSLDARLRPSASFISSFFEHSTLEQFLFLSPFLSSSSKWEIAELLSKALQTYHDQNSSFTNITSPKDLLFRAQFYDPTSIRRNSIEEPQKKAEIRSLGNLLSTLFKNGDLITTLFLQKMLLEDGPSAEEILLYFQKRPSGFLFEKNFPLSLDRGLQEALCFVKRKNPAPETFAPHLFTLFFQNHTLSEISENDVDQLRQASIVTKSLLKNIFRKEEVSLKTLEECLEIELRIHNMILSEEEPPRSASLQLSIDVCSQLNDLLSKPEEGFFQNLQSFFLTLFRIPRIKKVDELEEKSCKHSPGFSESLIDLDNGEDSAFMAPPEIVTLEGILETIPEAPSIQSILLQLRTLS